MKKFCCFSFIWFLTLLIEPNFLKAQQIRITDFNKIGSSSPFLNTLSANDQFGSSLSIIGDVDKNGVTEIAVGAIGDDDGGNNKGCVYILFRDTDLSIMAVQKISDTEGGFTGVLDNEDRFGSAVAAVGDLNNDGIDDIAVGSLYDSDGGYQSGAVWILFLNTNGTVKSYQKISSIEGNFTGTLPDLASFGCSVAFLGDLNKDNVGDIIVGAYRDNSNLQSKSGAAYILFLNANGTVKSHTKIGAGDSGFNGSLSHEDYFGGEIERTADYDNNGIADIAISAHRDDDGGTNRGAVYILSIDAMGSVVTSYKISSNSVIFGATLDDYDYFGTAISGIGDLNNDGVDELLIGSQKNSGGGVEKGAFFIFYLSVSGTVDSFAKFEDGVCNELDLQDYDMLGANAAFLKNENNQLEFLISATKGDDIITDSGVIYHVTLSAGQNVNAGPDIQTCRPDSVQMNAEILESEIGEWVLYQGNGNIKEPNNPKTVVTDLGTGLTKLIWKIEGSQCPLDSDTVFVDIKQPEYTANAGEDIYLCSEFETQLAANSGSGFSGKWALLEGVGNFSNIEDPNSIISNLQPGETKIIWSIQSMDCEASRDTLSLFIEEKRPAALNAGDDLIINCYSNEINLIGSLNQPTGITYWHVLEGTANIHNPDHLTTTVRGLTGKTSLILELRGDICHTLDSDTLNITVKPFEELFIPNFFTPNGDKFNPSFTLDERLLNSALRIYNRWGKLVYSNTSYNNEWQANEVPSGNYYYVIHNPCKLESYTGWLTVRK